MDESELRTHLFGSSSLGREHRKTVLAYVCVLGGFFFFFVFLSQPQPVGEPAPGTLTSLHAWAEVTWGVLPGDGPEFQSRLQFSKSKAPGN